jgi:hypothetical protein
MVLSPPRPLPIVSGYTIERIKESLQYVDNTLRHPELQISPAGVKALELYQESCFDLLDLLDVDGKTNTIVMTGSERRTILAGRRRFLQFTEGGLRWNCFMRVGCTEQERELQNEILNLIRSSYYAKYNDYFTAICKSLRLPANHQDLNGWGTMSVSSNLY